MKGLFRLVVMGLALASVSLAGCTYSYYGEPGYVRHEPVHYYDYYYYPSVGVYFHVYSGYYYYRRGSAWVRVKRLPSYIHLNQHDRRTIRSKDYRPYLKYDQHRKQYPPRGKQENGRYDRQERDRNAKRYNDYQRKYSTRDEYQRQRRMDDQRQQEYKRQYEQHERNQESPGTRKQSGPSHKQQQYDQRQRPEKEQKQQKQDKRQHSDKQEYEKKLFFRDQSGH